MSSITITDNQLGPQARPYQRLGWGMTGCHGLKGMGTDQEIIWNEEGLRCRCSVVRMEDGDLARL